jgi:hypothetical protein
MALHVICRVIVLITYENITQKTYPIEITGASTIEALGCQKRSATELSQTRGFLAGIG